MLQTRVRIGLDYRVRQISETGRSKVFFRSELRDMLPEIADHRISFIRLKRLDKNDTIYSQYKGGMMWKPTARRFGFKGEEFPLSISMLALPQFLRGVGDLTLRNDVGARWIADTSQLRLERKRNELLIRCHQAPSIEGCTDFFLSAGNISAFQRYNEFVRLDFTVTDSLGNQRTLALFHDGRRSPWLGIKSGRYFSRIFMISSDGIRLRFVYGRSRNFNVAVMYNSDPCGAYSIEWNTSSEANSAPTNQDMRITGEVKLVRTLEQRMELQGTAYDHARLGSEVAYTVASKLFKLGRVILFEPSRGGKDLVSRDGRVVIQARMLVRTRQLTRARLSDEVSRNTKNLLAKLGQDFRYNPSALCGLAVLTYADDKNTLKLIAYLKVKADQQETWQGRDSKDFNLLTFGHQKVGPSSSLV